MRTQLEYYGGGSYDLAERFVTADYVDREARPGTPDPGRSKRRAALGGAARSATSPTRPRTRSAVGIASQLSR